MLGSEAADLDLNVAPPAVIMMVGLQGSGKTTTTAKIAKRLKDKERKKVLMASLDVNRPVAQEQPAVLGQPIDVARTAARCVGKECVSKCRHRWCPSN